MMASSSQNASRASASGKYCVWCKVWWKIFKWLPVVFIVTVVVWSYYAYVVQLCIFTIKSNIEKLLYLIFYHILIIMFLWSYWQVIFTDIIAIPEKFKLPQSEMEKLLSAENEDAQRIILESFSSQLPVVTRTLSGAVRFCNRCAIIKPDRAHHCSMCGVCVLKMDHHCPWINNCVCFHNYKFFVLFLGYSLLYCLFVTATAMQYFIQFWKGDMTQGMGKFHVIFVFFVALMFAISLGSLFSYHCYLVLNNRSTIEAFRAPMFRSGPDKNGFSLGAYQNMVQVFGADPKKWLLPVFTSLGEGIAYPQRTPDEDTESLLSSERWEERAHPFSQQERPFRQPDRPYVHHERPFADNADSSGSFDDL